MKRSRFTEEQIIAILREQEAGVAAASVRASTSSATPTTVPAGVSGAIAGRMPTSTPSRAMRSWTAGAAHAAAEVRAKARPTTGRRRKGGSGNDKDPTPAQGRTGFGTVACLRRPGRFGRQGGCDVETFAARAVDGAASTPLLVG